MIMEIQQVINCWISFFSACAVYISYYIITLKRLFEFCETSEISLTGIDFYTLRNNIEAY